MFCGLYLGVVRVSAMVVDVGTVSWLDFVVGVGGMITLHRVVVRFLQLWFLWDVPCYGR